MESPIKSFHDLIFRWGTAEAFAADVDVTGGKARTWGARQRIPSRYWRRVLNAAAKRGYDEITETLLIDLDNIDRAS